jgi:hypothetical protein
MIVEVVLMEWVWMEDVCPVGLMSVFVSLSIVWFGRFGWLFVEAPSSHSIPTNGIAQRVNWNPSPRQSQSRRDIHDPGFSGTQDKEWKNRRKRWQGGLVRVDQARGGAAEKGAAVGDLSIYIGELLVP